MHSIQLKITEKRLTDKNRSTNIPSLLVFDDNPQQNKGFDKKKIIIQKGYILFWAPFASQSLFLQSVT